MLEWAWAEWKLTKKSNQIKHIYKTRSGKINKYWWIDLTNRCTLCYSLLIAFPHPHLFSPSITPHCRWFWNKPPRPVEGSWLCSACTIWVEYIEPEGLAIGPANERIEKLIFCSDAFAPRFLQTVNARPDTTASRGVGNAPKTRWHGRHSPGIRGQTLNSSIRRSLQVCIFTDATACWERHMRWEIERGDG